MHVIGRRQLHSLVHVWSVSRGLQHGRFDGRCCRRRWRWNGRVLGEVVRRRTIIPPSRRVTRPRETAGCGGKQRGCCVIRHAASTKGNPHPLGAMQCCKLTGIMCVCFAGVWLSLWLSLACPSDDTKSLSAPLSFPFPRGSLFSSSRALSGQARTRINL